MSGASPRRSTSPAYLDDLTQIGAGRVRTFPRFTVPHVNHSAVSSFFDQCTGGELLVNCRRSECDRSNGVHLRSSLLIGDSSTVVENISPVSSSRTSLNIPAGHASRTRLRELVSGIFDHPSRTYCYGAGRSVYSEDPLTYNSLLSFAPSPWFVNENNWQLSHLPTCLHRSLYDFA